MERGEKSTLRLLNEIFYSRLKTEPLKFASDKFITSHHRINLLFPVWTNEWSSASFYRLKSKRKQINLIYLKRILKTLLSGIFGLTIVGSSNWIIGDVNMNNFAHLQLVSS